MKAGFGHGLCLLIAVTGAGCSGSPAAEPPPVRAESVAKLSVTISGNPSFSAAQAATTYPIVVSAYDSNGKLITGNYAQQVVVVVIPPLCQPGLGLQGGSTPTGPIYVPVAVGVCGPGESAPASATAVTSSSTAIALTWNGTPLSAPAQLYVYATNVPQVTLTL